MAEARGQTVWLAQGARDKLATMKSVSVFPEPHSEGMACAHLVPIEDESLPHPGDGRQWEYNGERVTILGPPLRRANGNAVIPFEVYAPDAKGVLRMKAPFVLRERKPEPEHKPCPIEEMSDEELARRIREALS